MVERSSRFSSRSSSRSTRMGRRADLSDDFSPDFSGGGGVALGLPPSIRVGPPGFFGSLVICLFRLRADRLGDFRKLVEDRHATQPLAVLDRGIAAHGDAGIDVVWDAALGGGDGAVADGAVSGDADRSEEHTPEPQS